MKLTKDEIFRLLIKAGWFEGEAEGEAEDIFNEERYCHQCGNIHIIYESPAEGYSCPKCGSSDSDE